MAARMANKFDLTVLDGRPALAAWHARVSERASLQGPA